jgi:hypothetical protein
MPVGGYSLPKAQGDEEAEEDMEDGKEEVKYSKERITEKKVNINSVLYFTIVREENEKVWKRKNGSRRKKTVR